MVNRRELYEKCVNKLEEKDIDTADFDVRCIFSDVLQERNVIKNGAPISDENAARIQDITARYADGYPLQYLLGKWEFYGLPFYVGEGVLIPRQDTETLVEFVLNTFKNGDISAVDLCAGSGCISIAIEKNITCRITAVERSPQAYEYLLKNIQLNSSGVTPMLADVTEKQTAEQFHDLDLIVCNPPYLTEDDMRHLQKQVGYEPKEALYGGIDGCDYYRDIVRLWKNSLKDGGVMCFEIGVGQEDEVSGIMIQHGIENVRSRKDLCGKFRIVTGVWRSE